MTVLTRAAVLILLSAPIGGLFSASVPESSPAAARNTLYWAGVPVNNWDLSGGTPWRATSTGQPAACADGDSVVLDDRGSNFLVQVNSALSPGAVVISNQVQDYVLSGAGNLGTNGLAKRGGGVLTLALAGGYSGPAQVDGGILDLEIPGLTLDAATGSTLSIAANARVRSAAQPLKLNVNTTGVAVDIAGDGVLELAGNPASAPDQPDLDFGPNHTENADYGCRLAPNLDLGSARRIIRGWSGCNDVARNNLAGCDCQFAGTISGSGSLTLAGQNCWRGVNLMEVPFAFLASNSYTGTLEIQRGSVYLGNPHALTAGNILLLDPPASMNSRLFLYGFPAEVADLQSAGAGTALIANGNNLSTTNVGPVTLVVNENHSTTFAGTLTDWFTEFTAPETGPLTPVLSLVKNGPAALTLSGTNDYSGTTTINAGALFIDGESSGQGAITVGSGATLGGAGTVASTNVLVQNGGAIEAGDATAPGNFQLGVLSLGSATGDHANLNLAALGSLTVSSPGGLVLQGGAGSVTVNVTGEIPSGGIFPIIKYQGTLGGAGFAAFRIGALPPGVRGFLSNDTANAVIDLVVTQSLMARWSGESGTQWGTGLSGLLKNWVSAAGASETVVYADGESVWLDDTAARPLVEINHSDVQPLAVTISNQVQDYVIRGRFGIAGRASLTKQGAAHLRLDTVNTYSGNTLITQGTVALGNARAIPGGSGAGAVSLDGALDLAGRSPEINDLSGAGAVDNLEGGGFPVLTVNERCDTLFSGSIRNQTGRLGMTITGPGTLTLAGINSYSGPTLVSQGGLVVNGTMGDTPVTVRSAAALGGTGTIAGRAELQSGAVLNLTAGHPMTLGDLAVKGPVSVKVSGDIQATHPGTYILLNYRSIDATNLFRLAPLSAFLSTPYSASVRVGAGQMQLVVAPRVATGTIADVRHVVIFTQENRSFDHYFGSLHGVHGFSDHAPLMLSNGPSVFYQPSGSSYELPFHTTIQCITDLPHDWDSAHEEVNNGWHDQWIAAKGTETMAYYNRSDIPYHYALADAYTILDEYHCCALTCTDPNRLYVFTGMLDPNDTGGGPIINNTEPAGGLGTNWLTYAQCLQNAGVSWKVYQANDNYDDDALAWFAAFKDASTSSPLYKNGLASLSSLTNGFAADVSNNVLPSVSWIVAPDTESEHPYWGPGAGAQLLHNLYQALTANRAVYNSTVFIINWDEGDGFFDHAIPILPPAAAADEFVSGVPIGLGERVPCLIVSPWTRGGYVDSQVFDHTSVLRFIENWTGVACPNISAWRRQVCGDLTSAFNFAAPNTNLPTILNTEAATACGSGTTANPPASQTLPAQESGTLIARPLPYQPNGWAIMNFPARFCTVFLTNSGPVSTHFAVYPNTCFYGPPTPLDVSPSNSATYLLPTVQAGGNYDVSSYGPNGFLRRFAGNLNVDNGRLESFPFLDPAGGGFKCTLINPGPTNIVYLVTNGWFANSLGTYTVPPGATNVVFLNTGTNNGWYDLTITTPADRLFVRRFAGHIETNNSPASSLVSSENPSGFNSPVTFTATYAGYGVPGGTVTFYTNGAALGAPVKLVGGVATVTTSLLPRTNNLLTAVYAGDLVNTPATNTLTQIVLNHPPVPATVVIERAASLPLNILISDLLTNVTDVDGDPITLIGVGTDGFNLLTTNGITLKTNLNYISYANSLTPDVNDSFDYTVSDNHGGVSVGTVLLMATTNYLAATNDALIVSTTNTLVSFFGLPGTQYEIDRSTNLAPGVGSGWVPISTNVAPYNGLIQVQDDFSNLSPAGNQAPAAAFYRLRPNP